MPVWYKDVGTTIGYVGLVVFEPTFEPEYNSPVVVFDSKQKKNVLGIIVPASALK